MLFDLHYEDGGRSTVEFAATTMANEAVQQAARNTNKGVVTVAGVKIGRLRGGSNGLDIQLPFITETILSEAGDECDVSLDDSIAIGASRIAVQNKFIEKCVQQYDERVGYRHFRRVGDSNMRVFEVDEKSVLVNRDTEVTNRWGEITPIEGLSYLSCLKVNTGSITVYRERGAYLHYSLNIETLTSWNPEGNLEEEKTKQTELFHATLKDEDCRVTDRATMTWVRELIQEDCKTPLYYISIISSTPVTSDTPEDRYRLASTPYSETDATDISIQIKIVIPNERLHNAFLRNPMLEPNLTSDIREEGLLEVMKHIFYSVRNFCNLLQSAIPRLDGGELLNDDLHYPGYFGDLAAEARRHYNRKKIDAQAQSQMELLRRANNQVKRYLINEFTKSAASVADIACGHGQDLGKFAERSVTFLYGVDISNDSIIEARRRLSSNKKRIQASYNVGNLLSRATWERIRGALRSKHLSPFEEKSSDFYDVVSCQLAIHYCLASEDQARYILTQVVNSLEPGGMFFGSCPDTNIIAENMSCRLYRDKSGPDQFSFHNSCYTVRFASTELMKMRDSIPIGQTEGSISGPRISFDIKELQTLIHKGKSVDERPSVNSYRGDTARLKSEELNDEIYLKEKLNNTWGISYYFSLKGHINMMEYLIPWNQFVLLAKELGLELIKCENFLQLLTTKRKTEKTKSDPLDNVYAKLSSHDIRDQEEVVRFYKVFAFTKRLDATTVPLRSAKSKSQAKMEISDINETLKRAIDNSQVNQPIQPMYDTNTIRRNEESYSTPSMMQTSNMAPTQYKRQTEERERAVPAQRNSRMEDAPKRPKVGGLGMLTSEHVPAAVHEVHEAPKPVEGENKEPSSSSVSSSVSSDED